MLQVVTAFFIAAISLSFAFTAPAHADDLSNFLAQVNGLRADHGLAALTVDPTLTANAQAWSNHLASTGVLMDDPNLASQASGSWHALGENTAYGSSFGLLFNALVQSPPHLANMLGDYTMTGVAETITPQFAWLTEIFEMPASAAPVAATPPTTAAPIRNSASQVQVPTPQPAATVPTVPPTVPAPVVTTPTTQPPAPTTTVAPTTTTVAPPTSTTVPAPAAVTSGRVVPVPVALASHDRSGSTANALVLVAALVGIAAITGSCCVVARHRLKR
ncbi:MAG: CAP domain-containing protein [Acidimicrobiales bacterium]